MNLRDRRFADRPRFSDCTDRPLVIGHRGAAKVAPENSLEGLAAAVEAGADLVEIDVERPSRGAELVLGHPGRSRGGTRLTFDEALDQLAKDEIGILVDLKLAGVEREVATALHERGLSERALVCSTWVRSLRRLHALAPGLECSISYPRDRYGASRVRWPAPVVRASAAALRAVMTRRAPLLLAAARCNALTLHQALVSPALVRMAHSRGAGVAAWTVNDPRRVAELARAGVDAIISDDPGMVVSILATLNAPETEAKPGCNG